MAIIGLGILAIASLLNSYFHWWHPTLEDIEVEVVMVTFFVVYQQQMTRNAIMETAKKLTEARRNGHS